MNVRPSEIFRRFQEQGLIVGHAGGDQPIVQIAPIEDCQPGDLAFVDHAKYLPKVREQKPAAILTTAAIAAELGEADDLAILVSPNVRLAAALVKQAYMDRDVRDVEWPRVHPSAVIHDSVAVPDDAVIGPNVVVGRGATLGERTVLMANVVVEHGAAIGAGTVLHPGCVVGYECEIGAETILKAGCTIGSEGFGFAQDEKRRNYRIPHTGKVVVGNRVVIGANTNIDRATFGATVIRDGVVIDAMCHIGHNCDIGEDSILCAHTGLSGSTRFGKRVIASGQTGTIDHITVVDDAVLLHRAGLNSSIRQPGMYAGGPAQPLKEYLKNMAVIPRLHEIWTRLKQLEKKVEQLGGNQ